jgi:site-specific recombinase XerD
VLPWIGEDGKVRYVDENRIKHPFRRITRRAGLPTIRFHDVRHSFASQLAMRGESLYKIGKLLGHKHPQTTERYAHLNPESLDQVVSKLLTPAPRASSNTPTVEAQA